MTYRPTSSGISLTVGDQLFECLLVMPRNYLPSRRPLQLLQSLGAPEPCWMVSCKPTLGNAVTPLGQPSILHPLGDGLLAFSMTWQWSLIKRKVPLSGMLICMPINPGNQSAMSESSLGDILTIGMAWQVMQRDALTKIEGLLIKGFPVSANCQSRNRLPSNEALTNPA